MTQLRSSTLQQAYGQLKTISLQGPVFLIEDTLVLTFPDCRVSFYSGYIQAIGGIDSLNSGFVFQGAGEVHFKPRHAVERRQLSRFTGKDSLQARFDYLALRSMSPKYDPAVFVQNPAIFKVDLAVQKFAREAAASLLKYRGYNLASRLLAETATQDSPYVLFAFRNLTQNLRFPPIYYYVFDAYAHESIRLYEFRPKSLGHPFYTLCRYGLQDYLHPAAESRLQISRYIGWVELHRDGSIIADVGIKVVGVSPALKMLYFSLSNLMKMNHVVDVDGDSLSFIQEEDEFGLTVFLPDSINKNNPLRLRFSYSGDLMQKANDGNWHMKNRIYWHPRIGYLRRARYNLVFKTPPGLEVVSIGRLAKSWQEGGWQKNYYITRLPAKACTFTMGKFKKKTFWGPDSIRIALYASATNNPKNFKNIANDIANSLYFYSRYLSPYPYKTIRVVETSSLDSQGFPGLINLSWVSFKTELRGVMQALRSHEVAHQWWGNTVGWRSYRDQWLSEGLSEYMGALYMAWTASSEKLFNQLLKSWRDDLLEGGSVSVGLGLQRFGFSKEAMRKSEGEKAGPVYMGLRLGQKAPIDYYLNTYEKGAYIMHMLRFYFTDDSSGSDAAFWSLLREYGDLFARKEPSTLDFINLTSKHAGRDMRPFFEQWLLSNDIPTLEYQYQVTQDSQGYRVSGHIRQENVNEDFEIAVPVQITFAGATTWRGRIRVQGRGADFNLGPFATVPADLVLNPGNVILARVKMAKTKIRPRIAARGN